MRELQRLSVTPRPAPTETEAAAERPEAVRELHGEVAGTEGGDEGGSGKRPEAAPMRKDSHGELPLAPTARSDTKRPLDQDGAESRSPDAGASKARRLDCLEHAGAAPEGSAGEPTRTSVPSKEHFTSGGEDGGGGEEEEQRQAQPQPQQQQDDDASDDNDGDGGKEEVAGDDDD